MENANFIEILKSRGLRPVAKSDKQLMLTGKMIRCTDGDKLIVAIGSDKTKNEQINTVVDAVHWHIQTKGTTGELEIMFGKLHNSNSRTEVLNATAILLNNLMIPLNVNVTVDLQTKELNVKSYPNNRNWMELIKSRDNETPPKIALNLSDKVGENSFRWYRTVTANSWSGRVEGLQVCTISSDGKDCILGVGKPGKGGKIGYPREVFLEIADGKEGPFDEGRLNEIAAIIKRLAVSRKNGRLRTSQREHLLESMVLRKKIFISSEKGNLIPICKAYPFQFPALWSPNGPARFIDVIMHIEETPYVVELKEPAGSSPGQGYRHAITQAVLYREFIKNATELHPWFFEKNIDPLSCQAAVAFPKMQTIPKHQMLLKYHKDVAKAFGIEVIEIEDF
ncbi:MAG: hypothetical protein P8185_04460 [Deltaproteobacteria bacterium]|jgi:hypothetical protein